MQRRRLLLAALGLPLATALGSCRQQSAARPPYTPVCSAASDHSGQPLLGVMHGSQWAFSLAGEERGHDSCVHPQRGEALFFARRPGSHFYVVDIHSGALRHRIHTADGYHLYGHGCLSADGRWLYTTENHVAGGGRGAIGVYDCHRDYRLQGHLDCGGIGPHELALMPDDRHLVVAIGGLKTLPASGRQTLNPDQLAPGLSYIDLHSAKVVEFVPAPHPQLSLRHLDVNRQGDVIVGAQFQGAVPSGLPLVYHHRRGGALQALDSSGPLGLRQDYVASVASDNQQRVLCSFPKDNLLALWSIADKRFVQSWQLRDCAGAVFDPAHQQFIVSSSSGQLMAARAGQRELQALAYLPQLRWDNHLSLVAPALAATLAHS